MAELMGRNEYARHRGCAPNAVSKAIDDGRIKEAVQFDAAGKFVGIRWEAADKLWARNTDPVEAAKSGKFYPLAKPVERVSPPAKTLEAAPAVESEPETVEPGQQQQLRALDDQSFQAARTKKQEYEALTAQLNYLKAIGQLVAAAEVSSEIMDAFTEVKTQVLRIAESMSQKLAAETDPARVNRILSDELRGIFDECSRKFGDDSAEGIAEPPAIST